MDGHIQSAARARGGDASTARRPSVARLGPELQPDVMSYLNERDIPNYWTYARRVRAPGPDVRSDGRVDAARAPVPGLGVVGVLPRRADPMSCVSNVDMKEDYEMRWEYGEDPIYAWTDITYLLDGQDVSLGVLRRRRHLRVPTVRAARSRADRRDAVDPQPVARLHAGARGRQSRTTSGRTTSSSRAAADGTLPSVSGSCRARSASDHPHRARASGRARRTSRRLINAVMQGPRVGRDAIFLTWDDWGGFYDHVVPPQGRRERLRPARARHHDQPVRATRVHRPPDADVRRVPQADRGPVPRRPAAGPGHEGVPTRGPRCARTLAILGDLYAEFDFTPATRARR